jgi:hypothetical protein
MPSSNPLTRASLLAAPVRSKIDSRSAVPQGSRQGAECNRENNDASHAKCFETLAIRRNPLGRPALTSDMIRRNLMRKTSIALAAVAMLTLPAVAIAQTGSGAGNQGDPSGSSNNAGNKPGSNTSQGTVSNPGMNAPPSTTGVGGGTSGSSTQPNATNNPQTGTQAPDAQKGGSGSSGAR